jgi:endonuclease/exonuclease/phosphatase family metal-dependent hydrolase
VVETARGARLKLLSFNIQAATRTRRYRDYVLHSWKQVLPHRSRFAALELIGELIEPYDIVALQESDSGSLRSSYLNQSGHLAEVAGFPFWTHQANRNVGEIARPGNGVLSRIEPREVIDHRLPGRIPGRGALEVEFKVDRRRLRLIALHLALGAQARAQQLALVGELLEPKVPTIVCGDFNCGRGAREFDAFVARHGLNLASADAPSFPSWAPQVALDHVLTLGAIDVHDARALPQPMSDHLPLSLEFSLR